MSLSGFLARPLLAGIFISGGVDAIRDPEGKAKQADDVAPAVAGALGLPTTDTVTLVRINGAVQVTAGTLLAFGKFRRLSALVLATSLVPTTYAGHRFWEETDPEARARQQRDFLKNAAMLGGLILAASDTGGRPSLTWTARKVASRGLDASAAAASGLADGATKLVDVTRDASKDAAAGVAVASTQAAVLTRRAARAARKADLAQRASAGVEATKQASRRAAKAAQKAGITKQAAKAAQRASDAAQKADLADMTKRARRAATAAQKAADSIDFADLSRRARRAAKAARKSELSRRARRAARRAAKAARKCDRKYDLSQRATGAAAKAHQVARHSRDSAVAVGRDVVDRTRDALPVAG